MTNEINTKLSNYYKKELYLNDIKSFSWAKWKHVGWPQKLVHCNWNWIWYLPSLVSSKSTQSTPKLLGLRLNQNLHAQYLFWAAYCLAPTTCLLLISSFNLIYWLKIYNANNNGKLQYWCCLPFSPLQMSSVASLLVACRLHQLSCTCLLRHWQYCHMKVFVETR